MSLINDMLKDLERTRKGKASGPSLLTGVQAVTGVTRRGARRPLLAVLILLAGLGLGVGARLLLPAPQQAPPVATAVPVETAPQAIATSPPAAITAAEPAAQTIAEPAPPPAAEPAAEAAVTAAKVEPVVAAPAPQPKPAPAPVASVPPAPKPEPVAEPAPVKPAPPAVEPAPAVAKAVPTPPKPEPAVAKAVVAAKPAPVAPPAPVKTLPTAAALVQEARDLQKNGQDALAAERLEQAISLEPNAFAPREQLANLHLRQGRRSAALELWREGIRLAPTEVHWRKRLARALLEDGDGAEAIKQLTASSQPTVAADGEFHGLLAAAYQRQGEPSRAAAVYRRLAEQDPRSGLWWLGLAIALEGLRDGDGARGAYQQALGAEGLGEEARAFAAGRLRQLTP